MSHWIHILRSNKPDITNTIIGAISEFILCVWYTNAYLCLCMRFICVRSQIYGTQTSSSIPSNVALLLLSITSSEMTVAQYAELHVHETSTFLELENYLSQMSMREVKKRRHAIVNAVLLVLEQNTMSAVSQAVSGEARKTGKINCNVTFQEQLILFSSSLGLNRRYRHQKQCSIFQLPLREYWTLPSSVSTMVLSW